MNLDPKITRRQMLARTALAAVFLGQPGRVRAATVSAEGKYPPDKALRPAEQQGWVIEYTRADVRREGTGLRAPSIVPAERFVVTPALIELQFEGKGRCEVIMPSYAHACNQTCLATKVEVEADGEPLKRGQGYTLKPLVTTPHRNRFWQVAVPRKEKSRLKIRVFGIVSNAAESADLKATQQKIADTASRANHFDKKYKVPAAPHWMTRPSKAVREAVEEVCGDEEKKRYAALEQILQNAHKKAQLTKDYDKDLERFVKDGWKGPCGANAEFVNLAASTAGYPCLFYSEGFVMVPALGYGGLHAWNTACVNGLFIADSLNPALVFPEYAGYVATSVGRNVGHPGGTNAATNAGWLLKKDTTFSDYYIYFSMFGYGKIKDRLAELKVPEGIELLGDFVARQRERVNER